uniref:Uncharacterized protein n=1 Tax=Meloidogyne enterolobii TaxID=390850 RepID=A0A6V7XU36_MELEN|nr:unnamed protein product [Meloidogyne enterolobii]
MEGNGRNGGNRRRGRRNERHEHEANEEFGIEYPINLPNQQAPTEQQIALLLELLIRRNQRQDDRTNQNNQVYFLDCCI